MSKRTHVDVHYAEIVTIQTTVTKTVTFTTIDIDDRIDITFYGAAIDVFRDAAKAWLEGEREDNDED